MRALTHQILTAKAMGIQRRPRHGVHFAVLLQSQPRRDKTARPLGGLHHQHSQRKPADNAVADGEIARMYTLGIVSGLIWAKPVFGGTVTGDPKEVISIVIWLFYSVLFHNRLTKGWKGRKPAQLAVFVFILCLFSIIVVNTFMEYINATIQMVPFKHLIIGLVYGTVFGAIVAVAGCYQGIRCGRSAQAVGQATTTAVVQAIVGIIVATAIITVICNVLDV